MRNLLLGVLLLSAASLSALEPVAMFPIAPTSADPIEVRLTVVCGARTESVNVTGNVIKVEVDIFGLCSPPIRTAHVVKLDPLPPGSYRLEVFQKGLDAIYAQELFVVRNGGTKAVEAHPFALPANSLSRPRIRITRTDGNRVCTVPDCSNVVIRIAGAVPVDVKPEPNGWAVWLTPPAHAEGLVPIDLIHGDAIERTEAALYYFERAHPSMFESVLFPVLDELNGANGSHWISEAVIANPNPWYVENANYVQPFVCIEYPCGERLAPNEYSRFEGDGHPQGAVLLSPRDEVDDLSFSLRVRDTSRVRDGFGTAIPVVREKDMARDHTLALLDIPRDPRYRVKIRIYAVPPFGEEPGHQNLTIVNPITKARTQQSYEFSVQSGLYDPARAYAELDLPAGAEGERSAIYIDPVWQTPTWAFATVTNNETQQVTVIVPNGSGPTPCFTCVEP